jgi:hypothetical protein
MKKTSSPFCLLLLFASCGGTPGFPDFGERYSREQAGGSGAGAALPSQTSLENLCNAYVDKVASCLGTVAKNGCGSTAGATPACQASLRAYFSCVANLSCGSSFGEGLTTCPTPALSCAGGK